jgi:succinylglutamate desuccinylase
LEGTEACSIPKGIDCERVMGRVRGQEAGPSLVVVAGIHGNEPAGVEAGRRVLARLAQGDIGIRGELVVLGGNVEGLKSGARYLKRDLNRGWTDDSVDRLRNCVPESLTAEDKEQTELLQTIEEVRSTSRGQVHLADLHTSSAPGIPFVIFGDSPVQRSFVRVFPIPVIIGLVEHVDGVMSEFWSRRGLVTFSVEGGQHDDPLSRDGLEAILWLSLAQAGMITTSTPPEVARATALLDERRGGLPRVLDVISRHSITPDDAFVMEPGFRNVHRVAKGQLLARDQRGEIRADCDGVVVLPLYQKLGNDGFFWAREVSDLLSYRRDT